VKYPAFTRCAHQRNWTSPRLRLASLPKSAQAGSWVSWIAARRDQSGSAGRAAYIVLASLLGDDDLDAVLTGETGSWGSGVAMRGLRGSDGNPGTVRPAVKICVGCVEVCLAIMKDRLNPEQE
jgi:hypothetical protein